MRMIKLPRGETDTRKTYVFPDPDALGQLLWRTRYAYLYPVGIDEPRPSTVDVARGDLEKLLAYAEAYIDLTTYELGQEHCVKKLRDIWRARRALHGAGPDANGGE
jgi:hypothetical protein